MSDGEAAAVVIGVGNPIMRDDGFGPAVLQALAEFWELPPGVELVDGGIWGMSLLPTIESAHTLILVDAINTGAAAGTGVVLERDQLPRYLATKISPHEIGLRDVLALAELRGTLPGRTVAIGVQPSRVELGEGLTPRVQDKVAAVAEAVAQRLTTWGLPCRHVAGACTS